MNEEKVSAQKHNGLWLDVGTVERLNEATQIVQKLVILHPDLKIKRSLKPVSKFSDDLLLSFIFYRLLSVLP